MRSAALVVLLALAPRAFAAPQAPKPVDPIPPLHAHAITPFVAQGVYERKGVGLLAIDVKDSTALHLQIGNRKARAMIASVLDYAEQASAAYDGSVVRRLGDGYVLAFPTEGQAVAAAKTIQLGVQGLSRTLKKPDLRLRAGVQSGRVLMDWTSGRPEVYGSPVEEAIALSGAAGAGKIATPKGELDPGVAGPRPLEAFQLPISNSYFTAAATLFAGLDGWNEAYERFGRRRAYKTVKAFHHHVRKIVERRGGLVVKAEGETVMCSFADPKEALEAALEIQRRIGEMKALAPLGEHVRSKVGLSYGRVLRDDRLDGADFYGNTVNAAARLMKLAGDGEVLAGGSVAPATETARLKGFADPVPVARFKP